MKTKEFKAIKPKVQALIADKGLNIAAGTLSISELRPFDKKAYSLRTDLKDSQKKWVGDLQDGDGTVVCTINNADGQFPVSQWASTLKGVATNNKGAFDETKEELKASQGWKFGFKSGVMIAFKPAGKNPTLEVAEN